MNDDIVAYERSDNSLVIQRGRLWGILHRDGTLLPNLKYERQKLRETIHQAEREGLLPSGWKGVLE